MTAPPGWTPDLCRRLRWKGMFVDSEPDPTVPPAADASCWCALTAGLIGPDGKPAERESCGAGRSCFEAS